MATAEEAFWRRAEADAEAPGAVWASPDGRECGLSFGELRTEAWRRALALEGIARKREPRESPVVAVAVAEDGVQLLKCQLAVMLAGATYLPLDPADPRHAEVARKVRPVVVVAESELPGVEGCVTLQELEALEEAVAAPMPGASLAEARQGAGGQGKGLFGHFGALSHIFFTSGSTGTPKGVCVSRGSLWRFVEAKARRAGIAAGARVFVASAPTFDPNLGDALAALCSGAAVCLAPRSWIKAGRLMESLWRLRATHVCMTPTMWAMRGALPDVPPEICADDTRVPELLPELRELSLGGEPMREQLILDAEGWAEHNLRLVNIYGVTEATVYQSTLCVNAAAVQGCATAAVRRLLLGEPYDNGTGIGILAADGAVDWVVAPATAGDEPDAKRVCSSAECPCAQGRGCYGEGEIVLAGPQLAEGYFERPELTQERFVVLKGGLRALRTGDLGQIVWLRAGADVSELGPGQDLFQPRCACGTSTGPYVQLIGRVDQQIKHRGVRIELGEIESVLGQCRPLVRETLVVKHEASEQLVAFVVGVAGERGSLPRYTEEALRLFCQRRLPPVMVPARFVGVASFESLTSANGKRDRRPLARETVPPMAPLVSAATNDGDEGGATALTPLERLVAGVWKNRLNLESATLTPWDSFAQLGGDSLDAQRASQDLIKMSNEANEDDTRAQALLASSRTFGELIGGMEPGHLLQSQSLREYCRHLASVGLDKLLQAPGDECVEGGGEEASGAGVDDLLRRALFLAAADGDAGVVRALADPELGGFSPDAGATRNARAKTPLHMAAARGRAEAVKALLECGANCFATTKDNIPASHIAAAYAGDASRPMLEALCSAMRARGIKSPLAVRDGRKQTLLHAAARGGSEAAVRFLLEELAKDFGADETGRRKLVNCMDRWHRTALHWSAVNGQATSARLLLEAGADPEPRISLAKRGRSTNLPYESPLEIARRRDPESEMVRLLEAALSEKHS